MKNILIINGPNLNLLGVREPEIYGKIAFDDYLKNLKSKYPNLSIIYKQSNHEGEIIDFIQDFEGEGLIINAGGYTHTSVAIRDALAFATYTKIEVHISNLSQRESFRHESLISPVCSGVIFGFGLLGYELAVEAILRL